MDACAGCGEAELTGGTCWAPTGGLMFLFWRCGRFRGSALCSRNATVSRRPGWVKQTRTIDKYRVDPVGCGGQNPGGGEGAIGEK